jgi:integrase
MQGSRSLTNEELNAMLLIATPRNRLFILTGITFGTRISEALELKFRDVEGKTLRLKSKKHSINQEFPIPEGYKIAVKAAMQAYSDIHINVDRNSHMFLSMVHARERGHVMSPQNANEMIRCLAKKVGFEGKISCHSFRKSFVTRIYEKTSFNIAATQKYSRHRSLSNLQYYISTSDEMDLINDELWG